jgi:hypothetical protein
MKWIEERDALIAQTKAFVDAVTRRSADTRGSGTSPATRPVLRDAVVPSGAQPLPPAPPTGSSRAAPIETAAPPAMAPLSRKFDQVSMTAEIRARIAAFRAHQERFNRERQEYFNATLARLRAEIDELPPPARRQIGAASLPHPETRPLPMPALQAPGRRPEDRT